MESVINYCWIWYFNVLLVLLLFCFHFHLFLHAEKLSFLVPHLLNPLHFSLFHTLMLLLSSSPAHPQCLPLSVSDPTPGSKVSCLTVNVLSFPQREAARQQTENYCVLHSINLHCVTHTHTDTYCWLACALSCEFVPNGTYCLSISVSVWGYERSQSQSAVLVCLSMVLNSIFYTLL